MRSLRLFLQCQLGGFVFSVFLAAGLMALDSLTTATNSVTFSFGELLFILVSTQVLMFLVFVFLYGEK